MPQSRAQQITLLAWSLALFLASAALAARYAHPTDPSRAKVDLIVALVSPLVPVVVVGGILLSPPFLLWPRQTSQYLKPYGEFARRGWRIVLAWLFLFGLAVNLLGLAFPGR